MEHRAAMLIILFSIGCGSIDPAPPTDEDGVPIPTPAAFDDFLRVTEIAPASEEIGTRPTIRLTFDTYLEEDALIDFVTVSMRSGGLRVGGRVRYQMTSRSLFFTPGRDLTPGLTYSVIASPEYLQSVTGAPFEPPQLPSFKVVTGGDEGISRQLPPATWAEVDAILEAKCRSCHTDPQWDLNPLTRDSMLGGRSDQVERFLVVPFDPADSYLMHKVLPDYPVRRFTVQPPPWSGAAPLDAGELLTIETWIRNGAR